MRIGAWLSALALAAAAAAGPAAAQVAGGLCARGATAGPVPLSYLFEQDALALRNAALATVDWEAAGVDGSYPPAPEAAALRDALAARAASLPPALADLPYLMILAEVENEPSAAVYALTQGAESLVAARLLDAMDRSGLTAEARLLREAIGLYPDWGDLPADRVAQLVDDSGETVDQALSDALDDLSFRWPPPGDRALAAAEALIAQDPATASSYAAQLAALTEDDRFGWLMDRLWTECIGQSWWTAEEGDRAHFSGGSAQAALVMMDAYLADSAEGGLDGYFFSPSATMAPKLALVFEIRGLTAEALALREGMALFGPAFPRDPEVRMGAMQDFTAEQHDLMARLGLGLDPVLIEADMRRLAREAGLMPG
ncbi:hypothetical protein LHP98_13880 [Rhodobacter sp. Har01]|uniref:DMP19 family protein n=1 Tax=Rhodobacter sp. Har01 TaxID=2883999 RepID=UPI001D085BAB|nr:hypothetical protein [Rhodobacter sp. Har01]MCB6179211.1 hypothetical protein [Rhodobacter sp. Har01]